MPGADAPEGQRDEGRNDARCSTGNSGRTRLSEVGVRIAPPAACSTRAATSTTTETDSPHSTEAARKITTPAMNIRLRPTRSASRSAGTSAAAKTMLYPLRIQDSSPSESWVNDPRMSGKAILTIVTSSSAINTATDVTASTFHRRAPRASGCPPVPDEAPLTMTRRTMFAAFGPLPLISNLLARGTDSSGTGGSKASRQERPSQTVLMSRYTPFQASPPGRAGRRWRHHRPYG